MIRLSSPALMTAALSALALTAAAPAFAAVSVVGGEKLCKAEAMKLSPAPQSARVDKPNTKASNETFQMSLRVKHADGTSGVLACTVDRNAGTAVVKAAE